MFQNRRSLSADPFDHGRHTRRLETGSDDNSTVVSGKSRRSSDSSFVEPPLPLPKLPKIKPPVRKHDDRAGLAGRSDPYADDLGIPSLELAATREAEWWAASDCDRSGSITVTEALLVLPDAVCDAPEDERTRSEIVEYRETLEMEGEDFDAAELEPELDEYEACIEAALAWPTLQYKPFAVEHKQLAPPPMCRGGATGEPCDAPPVVDDMAQREGYRSLETHGLICVERGLSDLPAALGTTLHLQLGINLIQLPRNKIETLHSFGRTPQIGCRSLVQLVELRLPGNALQFLPEDIGLLQQLVILDLSRNSLHELPPSFLHLEGLVHLDLTHNNYKDLPDEFGALTSLETLSLADNILQTLPSTLPRLHDLVKLDLSGNGLTHLCIFPNLPEVARKKTSGEEDWDAEPLSHALLLQPAHGQGPAHDPRRAAPRQGGERRPRARPQLAAGQEARAPKPDPALRLHTAAYNHRKMELAGMSLLDRNQIRVLPPSLRELSNLEMMRVRDNYLRSLPDDLGSLSRLTRLDCTTNELSELPASTAAREFGILSLQSNRFERLPPLVGRLHGLRRLMLGNNSLTTLPYEVGFLTTLLELQVFNNPLIDPPYETISDLPMMMWSCRQKYWALVNGPLPVVEARRIGVADEESRKLELQLQGVQEIPGAVRIRGKKGEPDVWMHPALESLEVLKLNMNHFKDKPLITPSLGNLRTLWLRACEIKELDDDIDHLQRLKELDLEDNRLTGLPRTFNRLRRLEVLNLAKNRLYVLPEKIGTLTALEKLDLAMNRLEYLPDSVTGLRMLKDLSVAVNNLYKLPVLSPGLNSLTSLNLDANELNLLPARLGELPLRILRASHNRLERLEADTFIGKASKTLKVLGVASNNLLELPSCLPTCEALTTVHVEYNPMRNPPAELLSEGMTILLQYCRLRDTDKYLNGPYYGCPSTDLEILERVDNLRHEREHTFYHTVLQALIDLVVEEVNSNGDSRFRRFACGVLIEEDRPWGRKGEEVWTDVELKTKQRHGKLILGNEVHRRKRAMNSKIKKHKGNLEEARNEGKRLLEKYEIAKRRKINFENGDAFNFHRLDSAEEAEDLVLGAAEEVDAAKASAKECERLLATAKAQSKMPPKLQVQIAVQDLKRKYCIMRWNEIIDEQRWRSVDNDWRRPWDGKDGCNYRDFMTPRGSIRLGKDVDTLPSWVRKLQPDPSVLPSEDPNDRHKQKTPAQIAYELFPTTGSTPTTPTSAPPAPALAVDDASAASTCVVHVATGDEFVGVSAVTWPTKTAYASARGYRSVPYVFDSADDLPSAATASTATLRLLAHRLFYHVDASADAYLDEYVAAGFPLTMVKATGEKMVEWPPASTDESFVMACAGADPLGCVETLHATFYGDAATPLTELADAGTVKGPTTRSSRRTARSTSGPARRYLSTPRRALACPTEEAYASAPDGFVPSAYSDLCAWQGVANMEATCDGTFAPTAPAAGDSKDLFPRVVGAEADYMAETRGGCGANSFCLTCYDDDGSLNANCDRVLRHYAPYVDHDHPDDVHVSTTSVAMLFWADIDYWCARA
ncbi:hypothetical protein JL722_14249 [Aureococcus anophagefferens]|nr:hypothetical protein JL722_14249 [Aureococcus anophagefferens]